MITLTEKATEHVKRFLRNYEDSVGVQIGIKDSGCSGFAYVVDYVAQQPGHTMLEFDNDGIKVYVDPKDYTRLNGLKIDYVKKGLNEGFEFSNPQETGRCGCGESVSL